MHDNDPLWQLRHALVGLGLALLLSVPLAALIARGVGDLIADSYAWRAGLYSGMLAHVVLGAVVLFTRVARHESRPIRPLRVLLWLISLWLWPLLLMRRSGAPDPSAGDGDQAAR